MSEPVLVRLFAKMKCLVVIVAAFVVAIGVAQVTHANPINDDIFEEEVN